jgi:hypothetical protein
MHFLGLITSTLAFATVAHCAPTQATAQDKGLDTCRDYSSDRQVLTASCGDGQGGWVTNTIDLNDCFTNNNGQVQVGSPFNF